MQSEEGHDLGLDLRAELLVEELNDDLDILSLKDVLVVLLDQLFQKLDTALLIEDPISLNRLDLDSIGQVGGVVTVFLHLLVEEHTIDILALTWATDEDLLADGGLTVLPEHQVLLVLHLLGLEWHSLEIVNEVLHVDQLLEDVLEEADSRVVDQGHVLQDQVNHLVVVGLDR